MRAKFVLVLAAATVLAGCSSGAATTSVPASAGASDASGTFPAGKPITIIVPWGTGGPTDTQVRIAAPLLEKVLNTRVIVENRKGGGGVVGTTQCGHAKPDGYTICLFSIPNALSWVFPDTTATYTRADFTPLVSLSYGYDWLMVRKDSPWQNMGDFVKAAKSAPDKIVVPVEGLQSTDMLNTRHIEATAGIKLKKVVFPDGSAQKVQGLLGGQVQVMTASITSSLSLVQSGEFRVLASLSADPVAAFPQFPTARSQGYDVVGSNPFTLALPAGVPEDRRKVLQDAFLKVGEEATYKDRMGKIGLQPQVMNSEQTSKLWDEVEKATKEGLALMAAK